MRESAMRRDSNNVRASTVREPGEYAVRGGILDLYPPGMDMPVRLDFFGDALESIRRISWPEDPVLGPATANIGTIIGGRAPNVIPDAAKAELAVRVVGGGRKIDEMLRMEPASDFSRSSADF